MTDIRDFVGKVQVKFSDAVIAATSSARTAETTEGGRYLISIRDIYMEFFDRSDERAQTPMGPGSLWNVSAVGEAADKRARLVRDGGRRTPAGRLRLFPVRRRRRSHRGKAGSRP